MACNGVAPPSQRAVHSMNRASPALSDGTLSNPPSVVTENGTGVTSDDSMGDNSYESPLDFSLKKCRRLSADAGSYGSAGSRSPEFASAESLPNRMNGAIFPGVDGLLAERAAKIGEPQLAMPGAFPGMTLADYSAGLIPGFPAGFLPGQYGGLPLQSQKESRRSKTCRPFKAYPKDPLAMPLGYYGMGAGGMGYPTQPIDFAAAAQAAGINTNDIFNNYRNYLMRLQQADPQHGGLTNGDSDGIKSEDDNRGSSPMSPDGMDGSLPLSPSMSPESRANSRKQAIMLPDDQKDALYWERRRKNNEAAKRSRDARRAKEDEIAIRAAYLEQENLRLKVEVAALRNETAKLRCLLYNS